MFVIHTREGHRPDLSDLPPAKKVRGRGKITIGDVGPMGRILVRGELGHDIVEELYPIDGEPVVDKPGKGAFYATDLDAILKMKGIKQLVVCGVTTEVCVHTSVREANDRGYDALVLSDCVGLLLPGVPAGRARDDQGPGRDLRLGQRLGALPPGPRDRDRHASRPRRERPLGDRRGGRSEGSSGRSGGIDATAESQRHTSPGCGSPATGTPSSGSGRTSCSTCSSCRAWCSFVIKLPNDIVFGRILPALGIALPIGNLYYAYLAYRLAKKEGRNDVAAMPYGPSVPHYFFVDVRDHAAGRHQDERRRHEGVGGGPRLGVLHRRSSS